MLPSLKDLSDNLLLDNVSAFKKVEDQTIADLVLYLSEVDTRKLYRDIGFSSLFTYCTSSLSEGGLGYSESSAYRRIQAARSLEAHPEIYELLRDGKLSLFAIAEISKVIKPENKVELLELSQGKAKTEIQKITVKYQAAVKPLKREKVVAKKVIVENKDPLFAAASSPETSTETRFTFVAEVDQEFMDLLQEAKDIVGFVPRVEVLKRTLKEFIGRRKAAPRSLAAKTVEPKPAKQPEGQNKQTEVTQSVKPKPPIEPPATIESKVILRSRYIPKAVAYRVRTRDKHQCTYISSTGRRCSETCGLELDHIEPFAYGGTNEVSNLRLLCSAHNQLFAEKAFGREKIEAYFQR
jgi:hypothetical protein